MESSTNNFPYSPLNSAKGEIRLVNLQPSHDFSADLRCDICHYFLDQHQEYEALSYEWGNPKETVPIFLDGTEFSITLNLEKALRHLRFADVPRVLWVDAICVNQSSIQERGEQVALIGQIYTSSSADLLWLGEDDGHSAQLIRLLADIQKMESIPVSEIMSVGETLGADVKDVIEKTRLIPGERDEASANFVLSNVEAVQCLLVRNVMFNSGTTETIEEQFVKFCEASVWKRVWIVQEVVLAPKVLVVFGFNELSLFSAWILQNCLVITQLAKVLKPHGPLEQYYWESGSAQQIINLRYDRMRGWPAGFLELWNRFGRFGTTDPRDRIYALLSLAVERLEIVPTYTQPVESLFIDVTKKLIAATKNLDILDMGFGRTSKDLDESTEKVLSNRPSWLPQFDVRPVLQSPFVGNLRFQARGFSAGLSSVPRLDLPEIQTPEDPRILCLSGFLVASVTLIPQPPRSGPVGPANYRNQFERLSATIGPVFQETTGQSLVDAYWRTLTCDQMHRRSISSRPQLPLSDPDVFQALARKLLTEEGEQSVPSDEKDIFFHNIGLLYSRGRFGLVKGILLAVVPQSCEKNDLVCIFYGGKSPMIIRPLENDEVGERFTLIGPAYVHGIMDGEALEAQEAARGRGLLASREFRLV